MKKFIISDEKNHCFGAFFIGAGYQA